MRAASGRPRAGGAAQMDPESLETENDESISLLEKKARQLRELTSGIRDEVRDHNAILDRVQNSMGGAGDMLKGSMTKFNKVFSNTENRILAYVVGGSLVAFAICWVLFKRH